MPFSVTDEYLEAQIRGLTPKQLQILATQYSEAYIEEVFLQIRTEVAQMLIRRLQDQVQSEFNSGYSGLSGGKRLIDSFEYHISENGEIVITNSKEYFTILNRGFGAFDMKEASLGKKLSLTLPGGKKIVRTVGEAGGKTVKNLDEKSLTKSGKVRKLYSLKNWIHPGVQGHHIYEKVQLEMRETISQYVRGRVQQLLDTVYAWEVADTGNVYYNNRDEAGRFRSFE